MGVFGAILMRIVYVQFTFLILNEALKKEIELTCMKLLILLSGSMISGDFIALSGVFLVEELIGDSDFTNWATLALFMSISFLASFVLEWVSIFLVFIQVLVPVISHLGYDLVWFCVLYLIITKTINLTLLMVPVGIRCLEITFPNMLKVAILFIVW